MRVVSILTLCLVLNATVPAFAAITEEDAVTRVQSAGYRLVSKAETSASGNWDVWASKDGIPYEVKINAKDGSLIEAVPAEAND